MKDSLLENSLRRASMLQTLGFNAEDAWDKWYEDIMAGKMCDIDDIMTRHLTCSAEGRLAENLVVGYSKLLG